MSLPSSEKHRRKGKQRTQRWRSCFISASPRADLSVLGGLLRDRGIKPIVASELPPRSASLHTLVTNAIIDSDFFIAVLGSERTEPSTYYELGFANGVGKPVLVLVPAHFKRPSEDLLGGTNLIADPTDRQAIGFVLDQVMAVRDFKSGRPKETLKVSKPLGDAADRYLSRIESLGAEISEIAILDSVRSAIEESGISVTSEARFDTARVDLAIWSDELTPWVGNPFLIEIKRNLQSGSDLLRVFEQVNSYLEKGNARWALVLYTQGTPRLSEVPELALSTVLFLSLREFFESLKTLSFGQIVRELRNERAHGVN